MRGVPRGLMTEVDKQMAEKMFGRKADPDSYLTAKEFLKKKKKDFVMSKGVGKVLDSKVGKGMVKVGNVVKRGASAPFKGMIKGIEKEMQINKAKDDRYRREGKALNRKYSGRK
jgi:hypothetical protein